jgi:hypothetical protein
VFNGVFANGVFNGVFANGVDVEDSGFQGRIFFFSFFRFLGAGDEFVNDSFVEIVFPTTLDDCVDSVVCVEELTIFGFLGGSSPRGFLVEESVVVLFFV